MSIDIKKILVVRTDNIGDLIVSIPTCTYLKRKFPNSKITLLARNYVSGLAELCNSIDDFISIEDLNFVENPIRVKKLIEDKKFDMCLNLFGHANKNGDPLAYQLTKFIDKDLKHSFQLSLKRKHLSFKDVIISRTKNLFLKYKSFQDLSVGNSLPLYRHEIYSNMRVIKPIGIKDLPTKEEIPELYNIDPGQVDLKKDLKKVIAKNKHNLILHPKSNGHCIEWPLENYIKLTNKLDANKFRIILTGSKQEIPYLETIQKQSKAGTDIINLGGKMDLKELIAIISKSDGLIAGSTGPMHISAAVSTNTLGIFPYAPKRKTFRRWIPIGKRAYYIVNEDINKLTPELVHKTIIDKFFNGSY